MLRLKLNHVSKRGPWYSHLGYILWCAVTTSRGHTGSRMIFPPLRHQKASGRVISLGIFALCCNIIVYSYTLSREYRVLRNRYSRLLFTSEDRLCANLCVLEQSMNITSQCQCLAFAWRHRSTVMTSQCQVRKDRPWRQWRNRRSMIVCSGTVCSRYKIAWGVLPMIFTRDFVTRENHWQITPLVAKKSLFTVTHALFFISRASDSFYIFDVIKIPRAQNERHTMVAPSRQLLLLYQVTQWQPHCRGLDISRDTFADRDGINQFRKLISNYYIIKLLCYNYSSIPKLKRWFG